VSNHSGAMLASRLGVVPITVKNDLFDDHRRLSLSARPRHAVPAISVLSFTVAQPGAPSCIQGHQRM
jgi:hypothetical protein